MLTSEDATTILTPSEVEQTLLILQGKCPHNQGWTYVGHGHNYDVCRCNACGEMEEI